MHRKKFIAAGWGLLILGGDVFLFVGGDIA